MNENPRKTTVTLEDLLRLKRAERPAPEFWDEFDRGLRAKQLAAIVEPRPWWAPFIRIGARVSRYQLPVGATAILAVTLLTIREYHPVNSGPTFEPAVAEISGAAMLAPAADSAKSTDPVNSPAPSIAANAPVADAATQAAPSPSVSADHAAPAATAVGSASHVAMVNSELTSAHYIAENFAAAQAADPDLDQMLGHTLRVENLPARGEPLAQISVPGDSRHSRLLVGTAWLASASTGDSTLRTNEQATHHLTERRLAESDVISRIDVGGNRLTVKF
jgi:hypothetical protein